ncbi:MAG TPA: efflux RND transporter periplasmic adaptor subunit [Patescibacteria group bacterium]
MKNKSFIIILLLVALISFGIVALSTYAISSFSTIKGENVAVKSVSQDINASGSIHSLNEATLHFPIAGKVVYLPFKEGDAVTQGQTIASLDVRTIADNLQSAVKSAQNQQISFDTVNDFNGDRSLSDTGLSVSARRQLETAANTLDQTQLAVEIQKIAQEQAYLISPINGVITHEDITTPNVNVTTTSSFSVADPTQKVFRAQILATDIDFVSVGASATIRLDGSEKTFSGSVEKIYPQKTTSSNGEDVYLVDISSDNLPSNILFDQTGSVVIKSNDQSQGVMVPTWAILGHNGVWVLENHKAVFKNVTVGETHNDMTEIIGGLSSEDKVILSPSTVAKQYYSIL